MTAIAIGTITLHTTTSHAHGYRSRCACSFGFGFNSIHTGSDNAATGAACLSTCDRRAKNSRQGRNHPPIFCSDSSTHAIARVNMICRSTSATPCPANQCSHHGVHVAGDTRCVKASQARPHGSSDASTTGMLPARPCSKMWVSAGPHCTTSWSNKDASAGAALAYCR